MSDAARRRPASGPLRPPGRTAHPVTSALRAVLDAVADRADGEVAAYIPELAAADPEPFGLALVSVDGHEYEAGDAHVPFTIQSVSKPFTLALALEALGIDGLLERVGAEPSGEAFNAISLEPGTGRPANPLVNAGAIVTTSLVPATDAGDRFARIRDGLAAFAGRPLEVDEAVAASEIATADRNLALAHLMHGAGSLREPVDETVATYCRQCAIRVTAADLAVMAATLAHGGRNPVTGEQVTTRAVAEQVLSFMASCGMYDAAGEWLLRVGLPAKSGVAGGLLLSSPGEFGIGCFSPRLDEHGNSVRGVAAARLLAERFDLHVMHHPGHRAPVVGDLRLVHGAANERLLLVAAQGDLEFLGAERLLWETGAALDAAEVVPDGLVLDLSLVTRLHPVAERMLSAALAEAVSRGLPCAVVDGACDPVDAPGVHHGTTRGEAAAALTP